MKPDLESKIRAVCSPILKDYEASLADLVVLCRYRIHGEDITREDVHTTIRRSPIPGRYRHVPYYDLWRPVRKDMKKRAEFVATLPVMIQRLIIFELMSYIRDETKWKYHDVYKAQIAEMDVQI